MLSYELHYSVLEKEKKGTFRFISALVRLPLSVAAASHYCAREFIFGSAERRANVSNWAIFIKNRCNFEVSTCSTELARLELNEPDAYATA
jgi:hypothetical protein